MGRKRRLCILIPNHWSAAMGGSEYQVQRLVGKLVADGEFDVLFLTRQCGQGHCPEGYKLLCMRGWDKLLRYGFFFDAFNLLRWLRRVRPDVIYQRVGCAYTGVAAHYASKGDCRMVWHVAHDEDVLPMEGVRSPRDGFRWLEKKFLEYGVRKAHRVVAQTFQQGYFLQKHYNREPAAVIPNFHPLPGEEMTKKGMFKVVWVANFKPFKQPEQFISLARDLNKLHEKVICIMIGAPAHWAPQWQRSLEERMAGVETLTYLGERPLEEVNRILAGAHLFVNTSIQEGFPNTFIQSWMRKVPVVSLHVDPDGVLERKGIGYCCKTYEKMLERVIQLVQNPALRNAMGERAQIHAFSMHSERNIQELIQVLKAESSLDPGL